MMASMRITLPQARPLTINAATTTGGDDGIEAYNYGSGALSITTTGTTTGTSGMMALTRITLPQARLSRLTRPPRRARLMALMLITLRHRRTEHHNNGYDDRVTTDGINAKTDTFIMLRLWHVSHD